MQDLFLPNNLELHKDGSVTPIDFTKNFRNPKDDESFTAYAKELSKFLSNLKDYERDMYIPIEQKKILYRVDFNYSLLKLTMQEEDNLEHWGNTFTAKYFLELNDAKKYAQNYVKQQSVACFYRNNKRAYKYHYYILKGNDIIDEGEAVQGKLMEVEK